MFLHRDDVKARSEQGASVQHFGVCPSRPGITQRSGG